MARLEGRLDGLYPKLTAMERASLVLLAFKEDRDEAPQVRRTMPSGQVPEFNGYIATMNGINGQFGFLVDILGLLVQELETLYGWLLTLKAWGMHASRLADHIRFQMKEPVTESGYQEKLERTRRRMAPASELAEVLRVCHDWTEEEMEPGEDGEAPQVSDAAFERVLAEKEREIAALVTSRVLEGRGRGKRLRVNVGSFYDWLGKPVPVISDGDSLYHVLPDDMADVAAELRSLRSGLLQLVHRSPIRFHEGDTAKESKNRKDGDPSWDETGEMMAAELRALIQMRWQELLAAETILEEAREEFAGEDVATGVLREALADAKNALEELAEGMEWFGGPVELPEPTEKQVGNTRTILERAREVFGV